MKRLSLNVTPEFERDLRLYMKSRKIANKSAAIRSAIHEAATRNAPRGKASFHSLLGIALKGTPSPSPKIVTEDDLWSSIPLR